MRGWTTQRIAEGDVGQSNGQYCHIRTDIGEMVVQMGDPLAVPKDCDIVRSGFCPGQSI